MELLAPAGNLEKLKTAYTFGADAAYMGVSGFSLRAHADTLGSELSEAGTDEIARIKGERRLYAALNMSMHNHDLQKLPATLELLALLPVDAVIIADPGVLELVRRYLPDVQIHLSTQANCTNAESARLYHSLGFSRIIPSRELSLPEIMEIKQRVPEVELEVFVHGAMCMAYSGRCFLSDHLANRSANRGDCAQPCRWKYALSEEKRPGEYFPVEEDGRLLTILSSRDLMLLDHLRELKDAGVSAVKIEGRMKSSYYVAVVTRAYRAWIDRMERSVYDDEFLQAVRQDLFTISHRAYTTGFLLGDASVHRHSDGMSPRRYRMMAIVEEKLGNNRYRIAPKNRIDAGSSVAYIVPGRKTTVDESVDIFDLDGTPLDRAVHGRDAVIQTAEELKVGTIISGSW